MYDVEHRVGLEESLATDRAHFANVAVEEGDHDRQHGVDRKVDVAESRAALVREIVPLHVANLQPRIHALAIAVGTRVEQAVPAEIGRKHCDRPFP